MIPTAFSTLPLQSTMLKNLTSLDYKEMTPIQAQSLPQILDGKDLIAQAKTGSGKTAAFGIGLLSKLMTNRFCVQGLVLCPTRELADQVSKELRRLARFTDNIKILTLCGGVPFGPQIGSLEHGVHIVVGTPGRILDHLRRGSLELKYLQMLVLDEADRMLDMGFQDDLRSIVASAPDDRQTLLFSATYPKSIASMSATVQRDPITVKVEAVHNGLQIKQLFFLVANDQRVAAIARILGHYRPESTLIFCNTKKECQEVAQSLTELGFSALAIHGDLEQRDRDQVLARFANKSVSILVATDVAARGIDIKELTAVINYELTRDPEVHIHRIGRTGRAGEKGEAFSLITMAENRRAAAIEDYLGETIPRAELDELSMPTSNRIEAPMVTLCIDGGRKNKMRPGDVLGALTGGAGIAGSDVGKINVFDFVTYVAIARKSAELALRRLSSSKIKGRFYKIRTF
jgi:ATP-independent RNA helicase DbpA